MSKIHVNKTVDFLIIIIICYILYELGYSNGQKSKEAIKQRIEFNKTDIKIWDSSSKK